MPVLGVALVIARNVATTIGVASTISIGLGQTSGTVITVPITLLGIEAFI